jgi:hypothetical protein
LLYIDGSLDRSITLANYIYKIHVESIDKLTSELIVWFWYKQLVCQAFYLKKNIGSSSQIFNKCDYKLWSVLYRSKYKKMNINNKITKQTKITEMAEKRRWPLKTGSATVWIMNWHCTRVNGSGRVGFGSNNNILLFFDLIQIRSV